MATVLKQTRSASPAQACKRRVSVSVGSARAKQRGELGALTTDVEHQGRHGHQQRRQEEPAPHAVQQREGAPHVRAELVAGLLHRDGDQLDVLELGDHGQGDHVRREGERDLVERPHGGDVALHHAALGERVDVVGGAGDAAVAPRAGVVACRVEPFPPLVERAARVGAHRLDGGLVEAREVRVVRLVVRRAGGGVGLHRERGPAAVVAAALINPAEAPGRALVAALARREHGADHHPDRHHALREHEEPAPDDHAPPQPRVRRVVRRRVEDRGLVLVGRGLHKARDAGVDGRIADLLSEHRNLRRRPRLHLRLHLRHPLVHPLLHLAETLLDAERAVLDRGLDVHVALRLRGRNRL